MFVPRFNRTKVSPLLFGLRWCFSFSASFFLLTLKVFKLFSYFQIQTKASAVAVAIVVAVWTGWLVVFLNLDWRMSVFHSTCFFGGKSIFTVISPFIHSASQWQSQSFRICNKPSIPDNVNDQTKPANVDNKAFNDAADKAGDVEISMLKDPISPLTYTHHNMTWRSWMVISISIVVVVLSVKCNKRQFPRFGIRNFSL